MTTSERESNPWRLALGIHSGTLTSRDTERPRYFPSLEACQHAVDQAETEYARLGYHIWFAAAYGPDGARHQLNHKYVPYR